MSASIDIPGPLKGARFVDRPNKFLIRAVLEPEEVVVEVHLGVPGTLSEVLVPGRRLWVRPNDGRGPDWTVALVQTAGGHLVSIDPQLPVRLVLEALEAERIPELDGWHVERTEAPHGRSRVDFMLSTVAGEKMLLEVKCVTWVEDGLALFPDAPSERDARHLRDIAQITDRPGWHATVLFVAPRNDATAFAPARHVDPAFADALEHARRSGVRIAAYRCQITLEEMMLGVAIPVAP